ncbi:DnaD domain-containing protein [Peribacillus psychrosaccharolyticus]|uniref:DnaD domain-containing protein n=1 Tax=Peribacillus psychrosaccharolyticus TaxID=1407 RepID=A0A974NLT5_PERPY|nr:DnaD domain-containing protein [Peribacillus psychrosaccharolyticus]MEC2056689.1 DnaD domain-containing protein [Peribacillus psychrosaccharolyticus]MED3746143.1 DnaD domain-containing protein [Peribacillus psychrosaccharolyticus]QQT00184.1 DnaD domain-containing protein [Peribacillus psychrosaccharolyticus]
MIKDKLYNWFKEGSLTIPSVLLTHYPKMGLDEKEVMLLLQLQNFIEKGENFPAPSQIADRMTFEESECLFMIQRLIQRGFVMIEEEVDRTIGDERYSLQPLYEKMITSYLVSQKQEEAVQVQVEGESLYTVFEQEFGRPLSPFECETLAMWQDDEHHPDLIKGALRESVISGKINFRYIDRILFEWKKNGIKTVEQAKAQSQKFRSYQKREKKQDNQPVKDVPFYNWLEQ